MLQRERPGLASWPLAWIGVGGIALRARFSAFPGAAAHLAAGRQRGQAVAAALVVERGQSGLAEEALAAALVRAGAGIHPGDPAGLAGADLRRAFGQRLAHLAVTLLRHALVGLQAVARADALAHDLELAGDHAGAGLAAGRGHRCRRGGLAGLSLFGRRGGISRRNLGLGRSARVGRRRVLRAAGGRQGQDHRGGKLSPMQHRHYSPLESGQSRHHGSWTPRICRRAAWRSTGRVRSEDSCASKTGAVTVYSRAIPTGRLERGTSPGRPGRIASRPPGRRGSTDSALARKAPNPDRRASRLARKASGLALRAQSLVRKALLPCPQGKEACNGKARSLVRKPRSSDHKAFCFKRKAKSLAREAGELQAHGSELRQSKLGTPTAKLGAPGARQKAPALELLSFEVGAWSRAVGAFGLVRKARSPADGALSLARKAQSLAVGAPSLAPGALGFAGAPRLLQRNCTLTRLSELARNGYRGNHDVGPMPARFV